MIRRPDPRSPSRAANELARARLVATPLAPARLVRAAFVFSAATWWAAGPFAPAHASAADGLATLKLGEVSSLEERFVEGLRSRGLFELAERYCSQRLARPNAPDAERAELTIELARTLAAHAIDTPAASRAALWGQADRVINDYLQAHPRDPQVLAVLLQKALLPLAAGELSRQEAEVGGLATSPLDPARVALRDAASQLKQLDERVSLEAQRASRAPRDVVAPGGWTTAALASLTTNVRFQLARAFRNQALCYLPGSSDQLNSLTQATLLLKPLAELPPDTPIGWDSRADRVTCLRLLHDFSAAERALADTLKEQPPVEVRHRLEAEQIRLSLDTGAVDTALAAAGPYQARSAADGPELSLARLEAYIAAWKSAARSNASTKDRLRQAATDQTRLIEQSFGAYWMRRAETLVAAAITETPGAENFDTLLRAAESYYRGGRTSESLAAYDRAARLAREAGETDRAFDASLAAATIEHEQSHWREALDRYRALATASPQHAKSADAHLLAIYDAAQLAERAAPEARAAAVEAYERLLPEHLRLWPTSSTSGQAAYWLGQARESAGQWEAAIEAYRAIPAGHPRFVAGIEATARALRSRLAQHSGEPSADAQLASDGARYFASLLSAPPGQTAESWRAARLQATLAAAEFNLEAGGDGPRRAAALLESALTESPPPDARWQSTARSLLVVTLAMMGRDVEAARWLDSLSAATPQSLLELSESLVRQATASGGDARVAIARIAQQTLDTLQPQREKLNRAEQRRFDLARVRSLADAGGYDQALAMLERLAAERPDDGALQEALAELLTSGAPEQRKLALRKWREVQQKSRPGTPRWFRASFGLAQTQYLLGNKVAAAAAVRLVARTYPELGGAALKTKYEQLLADCQR